MSTRIKKEIRQGIVVKLKEKLDIARAKQKPDKNESIKRLKALRKEYSIMQEDLAEILGKSTETIKKYENGSIDIPGSVAYDLAAIFGTAPDYILGYPVDRHVINKDNITEEVGLSEESVNTLYKLKHSQSGIDERIYSESIKTLDFINLALCHYENKTEKNVIWENTTEEETEEGVVINGKSTEIETSYINTIFSLLQDYISFDNMGEFNACDGTLIDNDYGNRYLLYNSSVTDLPIKIDLDEYTQLILKEKIFKALDKLRSVKRKEYYESKLQAIKENMKQSKRVPDPVTIDNLESNGLEIVEKDNKNDSITIRMKKGNTSKKKK